MLIIFAIVYVCVFMIACPLVCFVFSIFSDSMNIGGAFEQIGLLFVNIVFIPFILIGKIIDAFTSPLIAADMKCAIDHRNSLRA
jgi:hypothetical protein